MNSEERDGQKRWVIRDREHHQRTGCLEGETDRANQKLSEYLAARYVPDTSKSRPAEVLIADVLAIYADERVMQTARPKETLQAIGRLNDFWGDRTVSEVRGNTCRSFAVRRKTDSGARRDLEIMRAAIGHYKKEYGLDSQPSFTLPPKSVPRQRYMTRQEVAALLRACRSNPKWRHLVRLILIGVYTGTRSGAILDLQWMPNTAGGWVDLERGVIYRRGEGERVAHNKRRTPVKMSPRLIVHMRHWKEADQGLRYVVHYHGKPCAKISKAWRNARSEAGLGKDIVPHVLRHTRATWMAHAGVPARQAAASLGLTEEEYERTYLHQNPEFQSEAAEAY